MNHIEKLRKLLFSESITNVRMGLQLAAGLADNNEETMQQLIGKAIVPNIPYAAQNKHPILWRGWKRWLRHNLTTNDEPHYQYISLWLLGWQKEPITQLHLSGKLVAFPPNINQLSRLEEIVITDRNCLPDPKNLVHQSFQKTSMYLD